MVDVAQMAAELSTLSALIDEWNDMRDPEAVLWGRVSKVAEETGEAMAALVGYTGQNPRKGYTHDRDDLIAELLDVAVTALGAVEHLTGNTGVAVGYLEDHLSRTVARFLATDRSG